MTRQDMKAKVLEELQDLVTSLKNKVATLDALDRDGDESAYDLHDQLATFDNVVDKLEGVVERSVQINGGNQSLGDILGAALARKDAAVFGGPHNEEASAIPFPHDEDK